MKSTFSRGLKYGVIFPVLIISFLLLEFYGKIFERGVGHYLKWQNYKRSQLGRIWEKDRQAVLAQRKIQSIRSVLDSQEQSSEAIESFRQLFDLDPSFPLLVSRKKFLQLYGDFPGQWSAQIISPYELIEIDAIGAWDRVLLKRFGPWITIEFLDRQSVPVHEVYLSTDALYEVQATRTVKRGRLEEAGFAEQRVFSVDEFLPVLKSLDPKTQKAVFPDPKWFLGNNYRITRVGVLEQLEPESSSSNRVFGIEYDTDYYTDVLLIPVPVEIANNILSQIEGAKADTFNAEESPFPLELPGASP